MTRQLALVFAVLWLPLASLAAEPAKAPPPPPPADANPDRPEYRSRALPQDIFNPSEKVQEDTPVPFPEDI